MTPTLQAVDEWRDVDGDVFRDQIVARNRPAVLRGLVAGWPGVERALESPQAVCAHLKRFDRGRPAQILAGAPSIKGHFFYTEDLGGLNFARQTGSIGDLLDYLMVCLEDPQPPALSLQSTVIADYLPGLEAELTLPFVPATVAPRIWIGNAITVQAHFDLYDNIACVLAGRRRFTFFPPEQISNLYVGPLEYTPAGAPVSMASLEEPDFERYPRLRLALDSAQSVDLEPGDAVYIPYFWWHHVKSLSPFNVLVNYWWNEARSGRGSPFDCLLHALLTLRDLPPNQREAWRSVFDHLVFQTQGDPVAHLPPDRRGALGALSPEQERMMKAGLAESLNRAWGSGSARQL